MTIRQPMTLIDPLEGIDNSDSDSAIHVRIVGTMRSYCGRDLEADGHLPPAEVTESSWCPDCVRVQDGV